MAFTLAKKANQSYKDAFRAIMTDYPDTARRYYLEDISKKHYTEELLYAALYNHRCTLRAIPEEMRSESLCLCAVTKNAENINYVPEKYHTFDVMLRAVSAHPEVLHTALYMYRVHRGVDPADAPYSREDLMLMLEAARPMYKAQDYFDSLTYDAMKGELDEAEAMETYAARCHGNTDGIPNLVVAKLLKQALDSGITEL